MNYKNYVDLKILKKDFYNRDTSIVARELLGKTLIKVNGCKKVGGIIVETEAYYGGSDPASHAFRGVTARAAVMFAQPGTAYVYLCYGMYYLLNAVTEKKGKPGAVLIRALEPCWGTDIMRERREVKEKINLTNGPGKLTMALGINSSDNEKDLTKIKGGLSIFNVERKIGDSEISVSERIGIKSGKDKLLRYFIKNNKFISCM
jgi:DNA-3-methyladenine glycosylase